MKDLKCYLNNEPTNESVFNDSMLESLSDDAKNQLKANSQKIESILKKMNIGDFKYEIHHDGINFMISRRLDWGCHLRLKNLHSQKLSFDSIASYGSFDFDEDVYAFYKSVGAVLTNEKELKEIEQILLANNEIILHIDD